MHLQISPGKSLALTYQIILITVLKKLRGESIQSDREHFETERCFF